jgi:hypothetical protein
MGLEPITFRLEVRRAIQLRYEFVARGGNILGVKQPNITESGRSFPSNNLSILEHPVVFSMFLYIVSLRASNCLVIIGVGRSYVWKNAFIVQGSQFTLFITEQNVLSPVNLHQSERGVLISEENVARHVSKSSLVCLFIVFIHA